MNHYKGSTNDVNIVVLEGTTGSSPAIDRSTGFKSIIKSNPHLKIIASQTGEFTRDGQVVELNIRTSRVFQYQPTVGWRQAHHHGSIDDPDTLARYQRVVRGAA